MNKENIFLGTKYEGYLVFTSQMHSTELPLRDIYQDPSELHTSKILYPHMPQL